MITNRFASRGDGRTSANCSAVTYMPVPTWYASSSGSMARVRRFSSLMAANRSSTPRYQSPMRSAVGP